MTCELDKMRILLFAFSLICFLPQSILCKSNKNIVLFITDDQDLILNGLSPMRSTLELIGNKGVTCINAFVSTPICCPSRSSILTGLYAHNHETFNNSAAGGCAGQKWKEIENSTFGPILHNAGYRTFYAGKYLNQYDADYVPIGWDWWIGLQQNSRYYNYTLSINGTQQYYEHTYLPDLMTKYALDFLNLGNEPFLMVLSTPSPHSPSTPAPRHKGIFHNITALRTPNFNKHYENKHWLLNMPPEILSESAVNRLDEIYRNRWESLLAVDEMVASVIALLTYRNALDDTYLIFTSDNGYHIGQFGLAYDKRQPYETDVNVPLLIRGPNIPTKTLSKVPIANIDFAPTLLELAGLPVPDYMDGVSFYNKIKSINPEESNSKQSRKLMFLNNNINQFVTNADDEKEYQTNSLERQILFEYWGEANPHTISKECQWKYDRNLARCDPEVDCRCQDVRNNTYTCVRHIAPDLNLLFCRFKDSENYMEFYDLATDPHETENIAYQLLPAIREKYILISEHLSSCKGASCHILY